MKAQDVVEVGEVGDCEGEGAGERGKLVVRRVGRRRGETRRGQGESEFLRPAW